MNNLFYKVKLYLEANGKTESEFDDNISLQNDSDGNGDYIKTWNVDGLAQPTEEQLNALESQATTLGNNSQVIQTRKDLYGTSAEQLEYIVENGVDDFIEKQNQIKLANPKDN
jgi:hypothetical protein|tara:strand:- start:3 stop:341 length:339 start_codon:yes stop_codon:yes gene_type:complete